MRTVFVGTIAVLLVILLGSTAFSQVDIGLRGIGGELGLVIPEGDIDNTFGLGVVADLGTITREIHLDGSVDYWGKSYNETHWDFSFKQISVGGTAKYFAPVAVAFKPYGGAGLTLTYSKAESDYTGPEDEYLTGTSTSASNTDIGLHIVGGLEKSLTPKLNGFAELKYHTDGGDYFAVFVGAVFLLGK